MTNLNYLSKRLNYTFINTNLLKQSLSHCSVGKKNNERLEFLGDSILNMVIAEALYEKFPHESEGELSRLRAFLVKGETLANIALEIKLGDYLFLGQGELKSGGFRRESILADALEAIFAAIYLDSDLQQCKTIILDLFKERLADNQIKNNIKDPKTQLQEYIQSIKSSLPLYQLTHIEGSDHDQKFHISCSLKELNIEAKGVGNNRRRAEQSAANKLLKILKNTR
ncbi:MAG: ribonuclease III [Legionellales bacterium RIFCSPHIGHO2_12_FULL_35_11]|nr:MAG: ribonuclease III [Legionellales bacterium RIFCSPHIGHO2_12_FULL_35_11]